MDQKLDLRELEATLRKKIIGQEDAVSLISKAALRAELGLRKSGRPKAGVLLLGPTGVGKTEAVLSLADFLYGNMKRVKRFDMAEYQRQESLEFLLGGNRNEQGLLGDAIDELGEQGGGILLFDEIEKSYRSLSGIFLSALDAGRISMSNGETKYLSNCYLFFTSNLGAANAAQMVHSNYYTIRRCVENSARAFFSPELFARFDEIVVFKRLSYENQVAICEQMLEGEFKYLEEKLDRPVSITEEALYWPIERGYTRDLGARMMRKTIERELGNALVEFHLNSENNGVGEIQLTIEQSRLIAV